MVQDKDTNTEQLILEAAEKLFLEKGFALTSTTEISNQAGCNQAMVHYYYRTKEKLFEAIFEQKVKIFMAPFLKEENKNASFEERLKQKIENHFECIKKNPKIPFLFINEIFTNPKRMESFRKRIEELPKAVINKLHNDLQIEIEKGNIRPMETFDLLLTIVSLNVTLFLAGPIFKNIIQLDEKTFQKISENRKKENVLIIMRSLKP